MKKKTDISFWIMLIIFVAYLTAIFILGSCTKDEFNQQPQADFEQIGNTFISTSTDDKGIERYSWDTNNDMRWDIQGERIEIKVLPDSVTLEVADYEGWSDMRTKAVE